MARKRQGATEVLKNRPRPAHETPPMLVNDISHLFFAKVRSLEPEGALTQRSARVILRLLIDRDGRKQNDLAREAHLSAPTVSATLRRMESEGLIARRDCAIDGRAIRVYLTAQGRRQHEAMVAMLQSLDAVTMQGFDEEETALLHALLGRMRENLIESLGCEGAEGEEK